MNAFNQSYNHPSSCLCVCDDGSEISDRRRNHHQHPDEQLTFDIRKKKQEMDDLLVQAMSGLSFEERQKQQEILHGVENNIVETEAVLSSALEELDLHLLLEKEGSTYGVAEMMDPEYVQARAFRVMFLRGNDYDAKAAADQMLRFFELKKKLFGHEKLVKDITMGDLTDDDIARLKSGFIQSLGRDRSGRQVFFYVASQVEGIKSTETMRSYMRAKFFLTMKALESEETQLRGHVSVWYTMGDCKSRTNGKGYFDIFTVAKDLPKKRQALHICVDDMYQYVLLNGLMKLMPSKMRARSRVHHVSQIEAQYELSTYGILPQSIPLDCNGKLDLNYHQRMVDAWAAEERTTLMKVPSNVEPTPNDVLFTGCKVLNRPGNLLFEALVKEYSQVYNDSLSKRKVVDEVVGKIRAHGGRFLTPSTGFNKVLWEEIPVGDLRKKVMQAFRNHRRRKSKAPKNP